MSRGMNTGAAQPSWLPPPWSSLAFGKNQAIYSIGIGFSY